MKFQSFDTAWKKPQLVERVPEKSEPLPEKVEKPVMQRLPLEKLEQKLPEHPKLEKKLKKEDLIIIGLVSACFFLFLWAVSATLASNRIARLHSQLLDKLILNLTLH